VNQWLWVALVIFSYLLGSIPFGLVVGRLSKGIDIRDYGSGNIGTANALRTLGRGLSAVVFLCDLGKAVVVVLLARWLVGAPGLEAACAGAAVVGHSWPLYTGFRGGKGVASGFGALLALSPIAGAITFVFGALIIGITRYVSLGSVLGSGFGAIVVIALAVWYSQPIEYAVFAVVMAAVIVARHRENIARLLAGNESKIGQRAEMRRAQTED
jgi:acyl phosphate:glycerol-3-phosphate acyltransferase